MPGCCTQQIFPRRHHVLDHLVETVEFLPRLSIRIETAHVRRHFAAKEKLIEQHHRIGLAGLKHGQQLFLRKSFPTKFPIVDAVNAPQQILMNRVQSLVGRDQPAFEILRRFNRAIGAHKHPVAFHGRLPLSRQTDDRRALQLAPEKIRQIEIRRLHIAANQRLLLLFARRIRQLDDFHVDAVGLHFTNGQGVVGAKHAEAVAIVREGNIHSSNVSFKVQCSTVQCRKPGSTTEP